MAESFRDSRHQDCATCHRVGFEEPLAPDPYGYVAYPFQGFYTPCPWWVDCGAAGFLGGAAGGGAGDVEAAKRRRSVERYLGIRGGVRPDTSTPSTPAASPAGGSVAAPAGDASAGQGSSAPAAGKDQGGQQPGRTLKKDSDTSKDPKPSDRDDRKHDPNRSRR